MSIFYEPDVDQGTSWIDNAMIAARPPIGCITGPFVATFVTYAQLTIDQLPATCPKIMYNPPDA